VGLQRKASKNWQNICGSPLIRCREKGGGCHGKKKGGGGRDEGRVWKLKPSPQWRSTQDVTKTGEHLKRDGNRASQCCRREGHGGGGVQPRWGRYKLGVAHNKKVNTMERRGGNPKMGHNPRRKERKKPKWCGL